MFREGGEEGHTCFNRLHCTLSVGTTCFYVHSPFDISCSFLVNCNRSHSRTCTLYRGVGSKGALGAGAPPYLPNLVHPLAAS